MKKLSNYHLNPNNPRVIKDAAFRKMVKSIKDDPFMMDLRPIVVDEKGMVLAGSQRFTACQDLGMDEVPEKWLVEAKDLTPDQKKAFILKDNGHFGEWDPLKLQDWDPVDLHDAGLLPHDWTPDKNAGPSLGKIQEDDHQIREKIKTDLKLGDVITIGPHRLLCGSAEQLDDVRKLMDGKRAGMVHTDPPYGVSYQSNQRKNKFEMIENDNLFLTKWITFLDEISTGFVFIWTSWKVFSTWEEILKSFSPLTNVIIWNKGGGGMGDLKKSFATDYEMALVFNRATPIKGKRIGSVWTISKDGAMTYTHPTQKPVLLPATAIDATTSKQDIILDLFGGSGSTMVASHQLQRTCYMMELSPACCQDITERMQKAFPKLAITLNGKAWPVTPTAKAKTLSTT